MQYTPQGGGPEGTPQQQSAYPGGQGPYPAGQGPFPGATGPFQGGQSGRPKRPAWWYWAGGGALALVLCCGVFAVASFAAHPGATGNNSSGNGSNANTAATSQPAATATATHIPQWTTVQQFSGSTSQKTPLFTVPNEWRIVWKCQKADEFGGNFIVSVMNADGSPLDFAVVNTQYNDGATTYEHQGSGQVYLDVQTYSEQWSIQVQVQQ